MHKRNYASNRVLEERLSVLRVNSRLHNRPSLAEALLIVDHLKERISDLERQCQERRHVAMD